MATQKKYHNLVLLDESADANQSEVTKPFSVAFLFVAGIAVGAIFISLLYENNAISRSASTTATLPSPDGMSDSSIEEIAPTELQSITDTAIVSSPASSGCSIESLGRNLPEAGCSVDDYKEVATDNESGNAIGITELGDLSPSSGGLIKTDVLQGSGSVTNILDLQ